MLGAWVIWKHHNSCVFDSAWPSMNELLCVFREECHLWALAGAQGLKELGQGQEGVAG
ncbi:hypothetical protein PR202_gb24546 [Eleusine coracana subsp. coracana]|uniref:Uncharacterized protein n=1 Tax=Eleusine coracana subsp. coracana TaxID=191504 RepID=A0AAV5FIX7_ELECO|nr:hypothetical protein PR202_gb24546 [Eleusine coracana subsp. coracana]